MEIRRFFVSSAAICDDTITIEGDEYVHLSAVLRYKVGYQAIVCDNSGYDYLCEVTSIDRQKAVCRILQKSPNLTEPNREIILYTGMIKSEKWEIALQKAVELGARRIVPFVSEHTVEKSVRLDRANRIALESCKQCGRAILPTIADIITFDEIWSQTEDCDTYLAYEKETQLSLAKAFAAGDNTRPIAIIIGSEGGFTPLEVEHARQKGAKIVSLGKRILRAETASIVALGIVEALSEEA